MPSVNARYRVVEDGSYVAPGVCHLCGRHGGSDDRGMIDTQKDLDWVGVIYICSYCVLEMAETYGAASPQTQLQNMTTLEFAERQYRETRERLNKAEGILDALGAGHLIDAIGIDTPVVTVDSVAVEETPEPDSDDDFDGPLDGGTDEQPSIDERPDSERPDDFFSPDGPDDEQSFIDL